MRKLASVVKIDDVLPHNNADALEIINVKGWQVISQKGLYKPGDLAVYFEIDSFLPEHPVFEFLRKSSFKKHPILGEGFKLKTIKLRGEISQGLLIPFDEIVEGFDIFITVPNDDLIDYDLTELLYVKKWEPVISAELAGKVVGSFPEFIRKTDLTRIQNCFNEIPKNIEYDVEEKVEGTSCTIFYNPWQDYVGVCSRNLEIDVADETNTLVRVANESGIFDTLFNCKFPLALQGEVIGPGIQGNYYKLPNHRFMLFDIYDIMEKHYMQKYGGREIMIDCLKDHGAKIDEVPTIDRSVFVSDDIKTLLSFADGTSKIANRPREGLVFKSSTFHNDDILRFKVISNKFLLKQKGD